MQVPGNAYEGSGAQQVEGLGMSLSSVPIVCLARDSRLMTLPIGTSRMNVGWHKVSYKLRASSVINPFRRDALEQFRCPARL